MPSVPVFDEPTAAKAVHQLANPQESGAPLVFLVQEERVGWLKVLLPVRPNGTSGWVRQDDVTTYEHQYRIVIEIGAYRITVYKDGNVFVQEPIGVGTQDTPTPGGVYYTKELIQPIDDSGKLNPNGPYGPYAYGLSGFSNVLYSFAGGDGVIGIHGTNDPSSLGRNASKGCIRMSNAGITKLAKALPLGVPVEIRA
ncbi:MAG: L,D-transpeptidase [Acidimicrobiales bacterium]